MYLWSFIRIRFLTFALHAFYIWFFFICIHIFNFVILILATDTRAYIWITAITGLISPTSTIVFFATLPWSAPTATTSCHDESSQWFVIWFTRERGRKGTKCWNTCPFSETICFSHKKRTHPPLFRNISHTWYPGYRLFWGKMTPYPLKILSGWWL